MKHFLNRFRLSNKFAQVVLSIELFLCAGMKSGLETHQKRKKEKKRDRCHIDVAHPSFDRF